MITIDEFFELLIEVNTEKECTDFEEKVREFVRMAIIEDRKNVAEYAKISTTKNYNNPYNPGFPLEVVDKNSIINAPQIELK